MNGALLAQPIISYYGHGDGTLYSSHDETQGTYSKTVLFYFGIDINFKVMDDELIPCSSKVQNHKRVVYQYPDAHPNLKHSPCSTTAGAMSLTPENSIPTPSKLPPTVNQHIQKEAPTTTSAETTVVIKCPKTETSRSQGHVHASDFDDLTKSLIEETITIYCTQIGAHQPFPECVDDHNIV